jgi:outer membrane protein assembly factor BamB
VAKDDFRIGGDITHGQWSSPGRGVVGGKPMVFFGAGNGFVYGLDALDPTSSPAAPGLLSPVWKFNGQPAAQTQDHVPFEHIHDSHSYEVVANPVFHKNRVYVPITQEGFHGMKLGWLVCLDATKRGDITRTGLLWSRPMGAATATCAIADGLVYQVDYWGTLHCLDAETGRCYWTHTVGQKSPASPLAADGKLFVGAVAPPVAWVFSLGKEKKVLSRIRMRNEIYSSPAAANGTLYIATWRHLFAIQGDAKAPK